jgi:hypothetical protein
MEIDNQDEQMNINELPGAEALSRTKSPEDEVTSQVGCQEPLKILLILLFILTSFLMCVYF